MQSQRTPFSAIIVLLLVVAGLLPCAGRAHAATAITPDGTLGTTVTPAGNLFNINGGRIVGGVNQFHSFGQFSVGTGDIASFNGPASIQNILSRVTGGNISEIDGTLRSTISGANLFLMNPSGIIFGPNAQLDVSGSFHATTANYIGLADGVRFNSLASPADNLLTTAPPATFGFLNSVASIDVTSPNPFAPLLVPTGQTLSFVGGELNLGAADGSAPAYVLAPGGTVNLVSMSSGTARFNGSRIDADSSSLLGNVNLKGGSIVDGKNVYIRGGRFVADNAVIIPGAFSLLFPGALPTPDGGEVDIKVTGDVNFTGTTVDPLIGAPAGIFAFAGDFGGFPAVPAKVPDIKIEANAVNMSGVAGILTNKAGPGTPADVVINANSVKLENGASVSLINLFEGPGDNLTINARDVEIVGNGGASFTGLQTQAFFHPFYGGSFDPALTFANSGSITLNAANNLTVRGGAQITTDSRSFGGSGNITINAGNIFLSDPGGQISAQSAFAGDSGTVTISAAGSGQITIDNGFVIGTTTFGSGNSGDVNLNAAQSVTISGVASGIASQTAPPPIDQLNAFAAIYLGAGATFADLAVALGLPPDANIFAVLDGLNAFGLTAVSDLTPGNGGKIAVTTPVLTVRGLNSAIDSSTAWDGNAGQVNLNVGSLSITEGAQIRSRSGLVNLVTGDLVVGPGNAGSITVSATAPNTITISGQDSTISTTTFGDGNAGNIFLSANQINVQNAGSITSASGGTVNGQLFAGTGNAGQITVSSPTLTMGDGGTISVATLGAGNAGNIAVNVNNFTQTGGARVDSSTSGSGLGGDLIVTAVNLASVSGFGTGLFSTASSTGNAGEITVTTPTLTMGDGGTISVATSDAGNAGNIALNVNNFTQTGGARVDSSTSGSGAGGDLIVTAVNSASISGAGTGMFSTASGTGDAGKVTLSAPSLAPVPTLTLADNGKISVATSGEGDAGSISLNANTFSVTGGAQVVSSTTGAGQGGSVIVNAANSASISGSGTAASGLFSTAESTGSAGQIAVTTPTLTMNNNGTISVATEGGGAAGNIALTVNDLTLASGAQVSSSTSGAGAGGTVGLIAGQLVSIAGTGSGLFSTASSTGNAGQITVAAPGSTPVATLVMADGGKITVATSGAGNAGSVSLNSNNFNLTGGAQVVSSTDGTGKGGNLTINAANSAAISGSGSAPSGLFSTASNTGNAGTIELSTPTLTMGNGGAISVATSGAGNAGSTSVNVTNFSLTGGARVDSSTSGGGSGGDLTVTATNSATISDPGTGLFSTASGSGAGGDITLQAINIQLVNDGTISANSTGTVTATAGNVNVVFGDTFNMASGSITTGATIADGGNISITSTGSTLQMTNGQVTTSVGSGDGSGGNITVGSADHPLDFIILSDSQIRADAFGGPGGNINIFADVYLTSDSIVSASSALSAPGVIAIQAAFTDVSGSVVQLPETPLRATELLRAACAARFAGGKASSLVVGGRDGVPIQPGGLLPSPLYLTNEAGTPRISANDLPVRFSLLASAKDGLPNRYSLLPNDKCAF